MAGTGRLLFIDNLRTFAISMVVVMHAAVTYSPFGSWYFYDRAHTSFGLAIGLATYQSFQHAVAMGLLFGIAGYFARASLIKKGPRGFLRERAFRLGLPLLLFVVLVGPLTEYFVAGSWRSRPPRSFAADWWHHLENGALLSGSGPMWFCLVLLLFSAAYAARWAWAPPSPTPVPPSPPRLGAVLAVALAMAALGFAAGLVSPGGRQVLNVVVHDFPQYPLMFWAGTLAHRHGWASAIPARTGRAWGLAGLGLGALGWVALIGLGGALQGNTAAYEGGWHWQAAGMELWRAFICVSMSLGLVSLFRDRFNTQGPVAAFLSRSAFGVYMFHAPILIAITRAMQPWPLLAVAKFVLAAALGIALSFLFVGLVARRTPLRRIL